MKCVLFCIGMVAAALAADCSKSSTGRDPLTDPFALVRMPGRPGGLYPGASNTRPAAHEQAGLRRAEEVRARNAGGAADESGRIVLISIGLSNTTQEFSAFQRLAAQDPDLNPALTLVDGAQGGWSAERMVADPGPYWAVVDQRLRVAGVTPQQVQAAWMKQANPQPAQEFPEDARKLQGELREIAGSLRSRFPNLQLVYLSSRIYAGYATTRLHPEPFAWQSAFAAKWLIEEQILGQLNPQTFPWMAWGPYLWADGMKPREDGLVWACGDLAEDGTHPSAAGERKVARMLLDFFKSDSTARPWFLRRRTAPKPVIRAAVNPAGGAPRVAPGSIATLWGTDLAGRAEQATELPLPAFLGGAVVRVDGRPVPLYYASPGQINFLVPGELAGAEITVEHAGLAADVQRLPLQSQAPGLFTLDFRPDGPLAALHADGGLVDARRPARPGEILMLFFTGLGVRNPLILAPEVLPVVRIGNVVAAVHFYGAAPGFPGLNQINVEVPADAPAGATVPVVLQLASQASNQATIAVAR